MSFEKLFTRTAHGIKPGLGVTEALLKNLGNPQRELKIIHVAGTNGKGSVCAMIESVLRASGFKTGLFTSPHLFRFNERFRVNGQEISNEALEKLIADVELAEKELDGRGATFFEMSAAIAFEYFKREKVDYAIIETGLGGRWDATNVVKPIISVITRIALDHSDYLGDTVEKIAAEKAGIIKEEVPVICGQMPVEAEKVIYKKAAEKNAPILGSEEAAYVEVLESRRTDQLIDIDASGVQYHNIRLPLAGAFQLENCSVAVAALVDICDIEGISVEMKKGLDSVRWPGRFQILSMKPPIIYDVAHNPSGAGALFETLNANFPKIERGFVFAFMEDKDVEGILRTFSPSVSKAWAITLPGMRPMRVERIAEIGNKVGIEIEPAESVDVALEWVNSEKKRLLCFTGSIYLAEKLRKNGVNI